MAGRSATTATRATADPIAARTRAGSDQASERQGEAFLAAFSRAVQRASIYPEGHPAVPLGIGPLVDALQPLLSSGTVSVAVGRTRILLAAGNCPPGEHRATWLASRLFKCGIAALAFDRDFDAQEASRLIGWIAGASESPGPFPEVAGVSLSRFDPSHVRFRDDPALEANDTPEATIAWRTLTAALLPPDQAPAPTDDDPAGLASRIREAVTTAEGTGVAALAARLIGVRRHLEHADHATRAVLRTKLATLVHELVPELRSTVLTVHSDDPQEKILMLLELVDHLPVSVVHEIVHKLRVGPTPVPAAFSRFLDRLVRLSADDPTLDRAAHSSQSGPAGARHEADGASASADGTEFVPDTYRARLEELVRASSTTPSIVFSHAADSLAPAAIDDSIARIAILEAGRAGGRADAAPYLDWLAGAAPKELADGNLTRLGEVAELAMRSTANTHLEDRTTSEMRERLRAFFQQPSTVEMALQTIATAEGASTEATVMLAAGGLGAYRHAVAWFDKTGADRSSRDRVAAALLSSDARVQRAFIGAVNGNRRLADSGLQVLERIEPSTAIDLGLELAANAAADIRTRAVSWLVQTPLTSSKLSRVLGRAFEDDDARIVTLALNAASERRGPIATDALLAFAARRGPKAFLPLQARAVQSLIENGPDAVAKLSLLLRQRRFACSTHARQLSMTMAHALGQTPNGHAAVSGWRASPAGVLCWISRTTAVAP